MYIWLAPAAQGLRQSLTGLITLGLVCLAAFNPAGKVWASEPARLTDLIQRTIANHPSVRSQAEKNRAAQSGVDAAKWQFWPTPSIAVERANAGSDDSAYRGDSTVTVFRLQQPLWTGGRLTAGLEKAESNVRLAEAEMAEARQTLAERTIQAWSEALVAMRKLEAQGKSLSRHQSLLAMVERRFSEGASAQADVALARSRIQTLQAEVVLLTAQRDSAMDKLRLLTGQSLQPADLAANQPVPQVWQVGLPRLLDVARAHNPQLQRARSQADAAMATVGVAKSSLMPEVVLRFEHQRGSFSQVSAANNNRLFVGLSTALGAGLSTFSGVDVAVAEHAAALEDIAVQDQALSEQVQLDFTLVQAAQGRLEGLGSANRASVEVLDSYERQFLAGRKQWLDLMNAAREQAQSESQLADALGALQLSGWRLALWTAGVDRLLASPVGVAHLGERP